MKSYERPLTIWGFLWGFPVTLLGMLLGLLSLSKWRFNAEMLVLEGDRGVAHLFLTRRGFAAMTLGRAVLVVGTLDWATWVHELQHACQTERLGVFFPPAYLVQHMRFGYEGNPFEVEAVRVAAEFAADYPEKATEKYNLHFPYQTGYIGILVW